MFQFLHVVKTFSVLKKKSKLFQLAMQLFVTVQKIFCSMQAQSIFNNCMLGNSVNIRTHSINCSLAMVSAIEYCCLGTAVGDLKPMGHFQTTKGFSSGSIHAHSSDSCMGLKFAKGEQIFLDFLGYLPNITQHSSKQRKIQGHIIDRFSTSLFITTVFIYLLHLYLIPPRR